MGAPAAAGLGQGPEPGQGSLGAVSPVPRPPDTAAQEQEPQPGTQPPHAAEIAPGVPNPREAAQGKGSTEAEPQPSPERRLKRSLFRIRSAAPQTPPFHKYNPGSAGYNLVIATPGHI